jgi:hypothetical protein
VSREADKFIIERTVISATLLLCPLCDHTVHVPPVPISDALGDVFGMSGETLARVHGEQLAHTAAADMRRHLEGHPVVDWLRRFVPAKTIADIL